MSEIQQTPAIPQGEMLLLKLGEVVLKGLNRRSFEDKLIANVRRRVRRCGESSAPDTGQPVCPQQSLDADRCRQNGSGPFRGCEEQARAEITGAAWAAPVILPSGGLSGCTG